MKKEYIVGAVVLVIIALFVITRPATAPELNDSTDTAAQQTTQLQIPTETEPVPTPKMEIDTKKSYTATLTTSKGDIIIKLNADKTPITVNNFISLAKKGFYDGTVFHRVIKDFMIQGGDPEGNGTGGPGYRFADEPFEGEYTRGVIAMANAGPNTNGSQFFIMHADYDLPKNYVIFGEVEKGIEVVDKIAESKVQTSASGEPSDPVEKTTIQKVIVSEQ